MTLSAVTTATEKLSRDDVKGVRGTLLFERPMADHQTSRICSFAAGDAYGAVDFRAGWVRTISLYPWGNWKGVPEVGGHGTKP